MEDSKSAGRPKQYANAEGKVGAPQLAVRMDPILHNYVVTRPEGIRAYLERIVRADMIADEAWYQERLRAFEARSCEMISNIPEANDVTQWAVSAAMLHPIENPLSQSDLANICRRASINRSGWPFLYCDQGLSMRSWGLESWIDHSLGSPRLDTWNLDARGAFHHVVTRSYPNGKCLTFQELLHHPALALEAVGDLFSALGGPQAELIVIVTLRNALNLELIHHESLNQRAGPLGEERLTWEKHLTVKELQTSLVECAADVYEKFRVCFGPTTQSRQQAKQNISKLFEKSYK